MKKDKFQFHNILPISLHLSNSKSAKMNRPYLLIYVILGTFLTGQIQSFGQNQNNNRIWYFGDQAGIDFASGSPVALTDGAMYGFDNSATACDNNGNLVMYCNGDTIWNAQHQVMPHGTGLLGSTTGGQCALIVKQPGTDRYYVFTVAEFASSNGCRYSVVDMSLE
jgi:hypothetical protein